MSIRLGMMGVWPRGYRANSKTLDVDFATGRYTWNGQPKSFSDFTIGAGTPTVGPSGLEIDSGDQLRLNDVSWFNGAVGTFLVEWRCDDLSSPGTAFSMSDRQRWH